MARIQVSKKFSLEHLGDEWKGCYLQFHSFTIGDIEKNQNSIFTKSGATKPEDATSEETMSRLKTIVTLLQDKFIAGTVSVKNATNIAQTAGIVTVTKLVKAATPASIAAGMSCVNNLSIRPTKNPIAKGI